MKTHEKDLRYQGATRSIQWGGLPVALGVEPEFGPLLGASAELARALLAVIQTSGFGAWMADNHPSGSQVSDANDALMKAGVL